MKASQPLSSPSPVFDETRGITDPLHHEIERVTSGWAQPARDTWTQLLAGAASELQGELLRRALVAKHSLTELEDFAEDIRRLPDEVLYGACSLRSEVQSATRLTVKQRLRAEADPLIAFELSGVHASNDDEITDGSAPLTGVATAPEHVRGGLGETRFWVEDILNLMVRPLGVTYREHVFRASPRTNLLRRVANALHDGHPVPGLLVRANGEPVGPVLFLQSADSSEGRLLQVHALLSKETLWLDSRGLLTGEPLPFEETPYLGIVCLPETNASSSSVTSTGEA